MGIWSHTLFALTSHGAPEDYTIDISTWDESQRNNPIWSGFLQDRKTRYTLKEFMATTCDTLHIYGYLTAPKTLGWIYLSKKLLEDYSALQWIQYHFYCSDEGKPYYLEYKRAEPDKMYLYTGSTDSLHYKRRRTRTWGEWWRREEVGLEFVPTLYRQNLSRIEFSPTKLRTVPDIIDAILG